MKFFTPTKKQNSMDINIMPLLDVVLIILIFFIVNFSLEHSNYLNVSLPYASKTNKIIKTKEIIVVITESGSYSVNGADSTNSISELEEQIMSYLNNLEGPTVYSDVSIEISADYKTDYQSIVNMFDVAGKIGLKNIRLNTKQHSGN